MIGNTNLAPWLLLRICSNPELAKRIRAETGSFTNARQPANDFLLPEPPSLELDIDGIAHSCPLLKASFYECLRLDTSSFSVRSICKDVVITKPRKNLFGAEQPISFQLNAGEMLAIPWRVHHDSSQEYQFHPERLLVLDKNASGPNINDPGIAMPLGDGEGVFPGRELFEPLILALVAGFLALWDVEPSETGRWEVPGHCPSPNFLTPVEDVKVRLRRRVLP